MTCFGTPEAVQVACVRKFLGEHTQRVAVSAVVAYGILSVEGVDEAKAFSAKQGEIHETRFREFKFSVATLIFDAVEYAPCSALHATMQ